MDRKDWEAVARAGVREFFTGLWDFTRRRTVRLLLLAAVVFLLWRCHAIVTTLIGAYIVASAAGALVNPLCRLPLVRRLPPHPRRALVALVVLALMLAAVVGIVAALFKPFQQEFANLMADWPKYQKQLETQWQSFQDWLDDQPDWLQNALAFGQKAPPPAGGGASDPHSAASSGAALPGMLAPVGTFLTNLASKTASGIGHVVEAILLPILAFYFIADGRALKKEVLRFVPGSRHRVALAIMEESGGIMRSFLLAQLVLALIAGIVIGVLLAAFHIKYALTLALLAGVTRAVPVIGPLLGGIPVGLFVFVQCSQTGQYSHMAIILIIFTIMHLVESKIITPMILGDRLNLHAVFVIVALLIGGEFFGLLGMFLAAPVTALARVLLLHYFVYPNQRRHRRRPTRLSRALKPHLAPRAD